MRMGIGVIRLTVGSPTGVGDAYRTGSILVLEEMLQGVDLALALVYIERAVTAHQGDAGAVVSSVFKPAEALYQDGTGIPVTDVTNYSTHSSTYSHSMVAGGFDEMS